MKNSQSATFLWAHASSRTSLKGHTKWSPQYCDKMATTTSEGNTVKIDDFVIVVGVYSIIACSLVGDLVKYNPAYNIDIFT